MKDSSRTNQELLEEISDLKKNIQELEQSESECKRVEEALRKSEDRYRTLVENASDVVFRTDDTGRFTFVNPATLRITGYEEKEIIGKHYPTLIRPDMRDEAMKFFGRQFVKRIQNTYSEYPMLTKDGHEVWLGQNTQLIAGNGHVTGFQAVSRDITDRKRIEKELSDSEERYRRIVEASIDAVLLRSKDIVIYANPAALKLFRANQPADLIGKRYLDLVHPDDLAVSAERVKKNIDENWIASPREHRIVAMDGHVVHVESTGVPVQYRGENHVFGIFRDITERKKAEVELQRTLGSLRKAVGATVQVMVSAVETRDPYTAGHQIRSADLARTIATEMGLSQERIEGIRIAGSIHDIGKLSIPAEILSKPTKLSVIEFSLIKEHAKKGYEILKDVESFWPLAEMVYQHHERMDGSGYPRNLKGEEILLEARILAVADVVEAMASHRPYRPALGLDAALEEIEKNRGLLYDSHVVDTCLRVFLEKDYQIEGSCFQRVIPTPILS